MKSVIAKRKPRRPAKNQPKPDPSSIVKLTGLDGEAGKKTESVSAMSVTAAMKWIRLGWPITTAGDTGAIVVSKNGDGHLRCEFMVYRVTKDDRTYKSLGAVAQWLKDTWPLLGR